MGEASDHGNWSTGGQTSRQFSVKDMPGHTKLKYRQSGQVGAGRWRGAWVGGCWMDGCESGGMGWGCTSWMGCVVSCADVVVE